MLGRVLGDSEKTSDNERSGEGPRFCCWRRGSWWLVESEVEKDAREGRKKQKEQGISQKSRDGSGLATVSSSTIAIQVEGGWPGGRQLQVDDLAMGPSHTLFVMGFPSRRAANSNKQQVQGWKARPHSEPQ